MHSMLFGFDMRAHDTCHRTLVGDRQCRVAERRGPLDQLFAVRSATQEAEVRYAVQLGIPWKVAADHHNAPFALRAVPPSGSERSLGRPCGALIQTFRADTSAHAQRQLESEARAAEKSTASHVAHRARQINRARPTAHPTIRFRFAPAHSEASAACHRPDDADVLTAVSARATATADAMLRYHSQMSATRSRGRSAIRETNARGGNRRAARAVRPSPDQGVPAIARSGAASSPARHAPSQIVLHAKAATARSAHSADTARIPVQQVACGRAARAAVPSSVLHHWTHRPDAL